MSVSNEVKKKYFSKRILEYQSGKLSNDDIIQLFQDLLDNDFHYRFGDEILYQTRALIEENVIKQKQILH